jgi:hypothetical protein
MEGIQANGLQPGAGFDPERAATPFSSSRLLSVNVSAVQNTDLNIITAEGDKVTLSASYRTEAGLLTYERSSGSDSGYSFKTGELIDFHRDQAISLSVEGELSAQELNDIRALLDDLARMLQGFLTGDGEASQDPPADLSMPSSLSALQAQLAVEYQAEIDAANVQSTPTERMAGRMARRTQRSGISPQRLHRLLKRFLGRRLQAMKGHPAIGPKGVARGREAVDAFLKRIEPDGGKALLQSGQAAFSQVSASRTLEFQVTQETQHRILQTA